MTSERERETVREANRAIIWIIVIALALILFFWFIGYEALFG
jgi:hypothetical protein